MVVIMQKMKVLSLQSPYRNSENLLTKSRGTLAALRIMESCSSTTRFTTELRNSDVVAEPPAVK